MSEVRATAPRVTVLPATRNRFTTAPIAAVQKRRVAAYARVSTDSDEQLTSYEAQVDYVGESYSDQNTDNYILFSPHSQFDVTSHIPLARVLLSAYGEQSR